jgi:putative IMPACT (imprinted ancient) family translation regulator
MPPPERPGLANRALADEVEAINSIYGDETLSITSSDERASYAILTLPDLPFSFLLTFAPDYPTAPTAPHINGTQSTRSSSIGAGTAAAQVLRDVVARVWSPGQVCLFDVIEEAGGVLLLQQQQQRQQLQQHQHQVDHDGETEAARRTTDAEDERSAGSLPPPMTTFTKDFDDDNTVSAAADDASAASSPPHWSTSEPVTEKKSVFVARCVAVSSRDEAASSVSHLLATDKKVASATHNIRAWRIRNLESSSGGGGGDGGGGGVGGVVTVQQDCDDDGETAAGGRLLHLMQLMDVWNVVVVVTRWYGGTKLGPDRFRIINAVAREALVRGGFVQGLEEKGVEKEKTTTTTTKMKKMKMKKKKKKGKK